MLPPSCSFSLINVPFPEGKQLRESNSELARFAIRLGPGMSEWPSLFHPGRYGVVSRSVTRAIGLPSRSAVPWPPRQRICGKERPSHICGVLSLRIRAFFVRLRGSSDIDNCGRGFFFVSNDFHRLPSLFQFGKERANTHPMRTRLLLSV